MKKIFTPLITVMIICFSFPTSAQETLAPSAPAPSLEEIEKAAIAAQSAAFSAAYVAGDIERIMAVYTQDARIIPINGGIISDRAAIRQLWAGAIASPSKALSHETVPSELVIEGDIATDVGYYYGESRVSRSKRTPFGGAYVIVWKKVGGIWRKHLDMWNTVRGLKK